MNKLKRLIAISLAAVTALSIPVLSLAASKTEWYEPISGTRYNMTCSANLLSTQKGRGALNVNKIKGAVLGYAEGRVAVGLYDAGGLRVAYKNEDFACANITNFTKTNTLSAPGKTVRKMMTTAVFDGRMMEIEDYAW